MRIAMLLATLILLVRHCCSFHPALRIHWLAHLRRSHLAEHIHDWTLRVAHSSLNKRAELLSSVDPRQDTLPPATVKCLARNPGSE
jgi:hypothetical protein